LPLHHPGSRAAAIALSLAALAVPGCTGMGDATLGGRPLVYKNAPGDEVEVKAGIPHKKGEAEAERTTAVARAPSAAPAPVQPQRQAPQAVAQAAPVARGPSESVSDAEFINRYTQASRYGDLLFVSGQIGVDPRTGAFDPGQDIAMQTRQCLDNVRAILEANRLTMANVVSTTVYVTNISRLAAVDDVYHGYFRGTPPARTVVEVSNLPRGALVEITVVAGR